ncbi:hypothetical protein [Chamaesiphon minutus]|nr:hypothetical protein [Chamaesiphon minutus]
MRPIYKDATLYVQIMSTLTYTLLIVEDFLADRELYRRALLAD